MLKKRFDMFIFFCLWSMSGVFGADEVKSVMEGDSVSLNPDITQIQKDDLMWRFGQILIAQINTENNERKYYNDSADGRFRDRLDLDQTGSLTITDTRTEHTGLYTVTSRNNINIPLNTFSLTVYAHLPVPVISSNSSQGSSSSSSDQNCSLVCSAVNVSHVTLSWFRGISVLSSISVSDLSIISLSLEIECLDDSYSCVLNNPIRNQTTHLNITQLCQPCPEQCICCCGFTEAVIRLALSALVGVAAVAVLVYDIISWGRSHDGR